MFAALLTTVFFSLSSIFANRSVREVGRTRANLGRLVFAALCLGAYAHAAGSGLGGAGRNWFFISGVIGMGLGDLAVFAALPLLGSRLTVLITQCLAAPIAIFAEWLWLDTTLTPLQLGGGAIVLGGVGIAIMPSRAHPPRVRLRPIGFLFGFFAACGQGLGAVVSRHANALTVAAGEATDGITAAYQRILGGLAITVVYFAIRAACVRSRNPDATLTADAPATARRWRSYGWIPANALCGAVIGVSCYQWALATTPSGLVLPIVACTPLVILPLSRWLEGEIPTRRSVTGAVIAVGGVIALTLSAS